MIECFAKDGHFLGDYYHRKQAYSVHKSASKEPLILDENSLCHDPAESSAFSRNQLKVKNDASGASRSHLFKKTGESFQHLLSTQFRLVTPQDQLGVVPSTATKQKTVYPRGLFSDIEETLISNQPTGKTFDPFFPIDEPANRDCIG